MITIMNKLKQPLVLNLNEGKSKHLLAKGKAELTNEEFNCVEVKNAVSNGDVLVLKME